MPHIEIYPTSEERLLYAVEVNGIHCGSIHDDRSGCR